MMEQSSSTKSSPITQHEEVYERNFLLNLYLSTSVNNSFGIYFQVLDQQESNMIYPYNKSEINSTDAISIEPVPEVVVDDYESDLSELIKQKMRHKRRR